MAIIKYLNLSDTFLGDASMSENNNQDLTVELKRRLEETRLPPHLKEQILADLPPPEERERLFRELRDKGGLSSEQFFASLGLEVDQQP
jgi:hypothetical protein